MNNNRKQFFKKAKWLINNYIKNKENSLLLQKKIIQKEEELEPISKVIVDNEDTIKKDTKELVKTNNTQKLQLYSEALNIYEQLLYEYPEVNKKNIEIEINNQEVLKLKRKK